MIGKWCFIRVTFDNNQNPCIYVDDNNHVIQIIMNVDPLLDTETLAVWFRPDESGEFMEAELWH